MALPPSFLKDGFKGAAQARQRMRLRNGKLLKPLLIGTEGESDTGKTEFLLSCPGPGIIIVLDRGYEAMLDNPEPPPTRKLEDFAFDVVSVPLSTTAVQATYLEYFKATRDKFYKALANPDAVTVAIDGDSDFWELQRLADFGKLSNVWPQTRYGDTYAARRAMTAKAWDSGKIVIGTNKVKDDYVDVFDAQGQPVKETNGEPKRKKSGEKVRQGFPDQNYLWQIQIRHLYKPATTMTVLGKTVNVPQKWGLRILKCKANMALVGTELWQEDCCFRGLVGLVYPDIDPQEFGLSA